MWYLSPSGDQHASALLEPIPPIHADRDTTVQQQTKPGRVDFADQSPVKSKPAKVDGPGSEYWLP